MAISRSDERRARRRWLRVSLSLLLAAPGSFLMVPAFSAIVQAPGAVEGVLPRIGSIPIWSNPGGFGFPRLSGSLLAPRLLSGIPSLPAPEVMVKGRSMCSRVSIWS